MDDTFLTLSVAADETLYKEKNSKFLGYAYPLEAIEEVRPILDSLRKQHQTPGIFASPSGLGLARFLNVRMMMESLRTRQARQFWVR